MQLLRVLAGGTAGVSGEAFLRALVSALGPALDADAVHIAEIESEGAEPAARVIAGWRAGTGPALAGDVYPLSRGPLGERLEFTGGFLEIEGGRALDDDDRVVLDVFTGRAAAALEHRRQATALAARDAALAAARTRLVATADEERQRIGRDVHDGVQQRVVAIGHLLAMAARQLGDQTPELLTRAHEESREAARELRELSHGLHPVGLADQGLATALEVLAARSPLPLHVDELPDRRLPDPVEITVFYLASEAISNATKHAGAQEVRVTVEASGDSVFIRIADDGRGGADADRGSGLRGLRDRVETLGGLLDVISPPGEGTTLLATIPLAPYRDAREPFLEFGDPAHITAICSGERSCSISLAREWEFEGGLPRIGQQLPIRDADGKDHCVVTVRRVAVLPFSEIDDETVGQASSGHSTAVEWRRFAQQRWHDNREQVALVLDEPGWGLTDAEPMAILWFTVGP